MRRSRLIRLGLATAAVLALGTGTAWATFPYGVTSSGSDKKDYKLPDSEPRPNDLTGKLDWMYSGTIGTDNAVFASDPRELNGVRGAHLVDHNTTGNPHTAWETTTGRPEVAISVLDSGIKWNDAAAMSDLRKKIRLNAGELPVPNGPSCTGPGHDCNGDGVFNVDDYIGDSRVGPDQGGSKSVGPTDVIDPQDILIAFSNGDDADGNGYV